MSNESSTRDERVTTAVRQRDTTGTTRANRVESIGVSRLGSDTPQPEDGLVVGVVMHDESVPWKQPKIVYVTEAEYKTYKFREEGPGLLGRQYQRVSNYKERNHAAP